METKTVLGWHFAANTLRDGRPLPRKGETLKHDGPVIPCEQGLHGSVRALDALRYAPGSMVARVELRGVVVAHGNDKCAASERHMLTDYVDATRVLHLFACDCATAALDREKAVGRKVDPRSCAAVAAKLAWLGGKATDKELAVARNGAKDAARAAAMDAELAASFDACTSATRSAARDAAWAAAWNAALGAAGDAAWSAARAAQNTALEALLFALLEEEA